MIDCHWSLVTAPTQEPLSLDEAKLHASITQDDDNPLIEGYIRAAREAAQGYLGRAFFTQTWQYTQTDWSDEMWLPMATPLSSVTSVKYYDENGTLQTLSASVYITDTVSEPGRLMLAPSQTWPTLQSLRSGPRVIVTYVCGRAALDLVPELVKQGMRLYVTYADGDRAGSANAVEARRAAESCWDMVGRVYWRPPVCPS